MAGKHGVHNNPFIGWNPPAGDSAWARSEAERRGVALSAILTEALQRYRAECGAKHPPAAAPPRRTRKPIADTAPAATFRPAGPAPRAHALNCKCGICKPRANGGK
jgi:hypothetical protein